MISRTILHNIFKHIKVGAIEVTYWNGHSEHYGNGPALFKLTFHTPQAVRAMLRNVTLGFGESYMKGDIDIDGDIVNIGRVVSQNTQAFSKLSLNNVTHIRASNRPRKQSKFIEHHYDVGNDFYSLWLDESMTYSCAYFKTPQDTLEQAQSQKLDHVLRKLQLEKGMTLLDIGSGWGQLLIRAAQTYGVKGHGITLSREQFKLSQSKAKALGLDHLLTFELINYQDLMKRDITFDRIVSVGMYEHVGRHNHEAYFKAVEKLLVPGGITVLHTITSEVEAPNDPWIDKYIFPGGYIPSIRETVKRFPGHKLHLIDYENLRIHYAMTTEAWLRRLEDHREQIVSMYDESFYRMYRLYLGGSASGFRYDNLSLSQFVMTKGLRNDLPLTREFLYR